MLCRMDNRPLNLLAIALLLLLAAGAAGCASRGPTRVEVRPANYDAAFDATVQALRDEQFLLDRIDRRLGVITTRPRSASSFLEPWKGDNSNVAQAVESTLQYQRRIVRIEFEPVGGVAAETGPDTLPPFGQVSPAEPFFIPAEHRGTLVVNVRCFVERSHRPGLQVPTMAVRKSSVTVDPSLRERGMTAQFWEPIARDASMESRLKRRIADKAGATVQVSEPAPPAP